MFQQIRCIFFNRQGTYVSTDKSHFFQQTRRIFFIWQGTYVLTDKALIFQKTRHIFFKRQGTYFSTVSQNCVQVCMVSADHLIILRKDPCKEPSSTDLVPQGAGKNTDWVCGRSGMLKFTYIQFPLGTQARAK